MSTALPAGSSCSEAAQLQLYHGGAHLALQGTEASQGKDAAPKDKGPKPLLDLYF